MVRVSGFEINAEYVIGKNLENITKIGFHDVSVRAALLDSHSVSVIGCFDKEVDLVTEVLPHLKVINSPSKIIELKRILNKEGPTEQVKVVFEGNLPKKLSLDGLIYTVRKFDFNSKRCFHCSLYGHSSDSCNRKIFCAFYGANQYLSECSIKNKNDNLKCRHCKGQHVIVPINVNFFRMLKKLKIMQNQGSCF